MFVSLFVWVVIQHSFWIYIKYRLQDKVNYVFHKQHKLHKLYTHNSILKALCKFCFIRWKYTFDVLFLFINRSLAIVLMSYANQFLSSDRLWVISPLCFCCCIIKHILYYSSIAFHKASDRVVIFYCFHVEYLEIEMSVFKCMLMVSYLWHIKFSKNK